MNVYKPNISLRTFLKTKVKYLKVKQTGSFLRSGNCRSKTSFRKIYYVQILTVLCINYWSVNV